MPRACASFFDRSSPGHLTGYQRDVLQQERIRAFAQTATGVYPCINTSCDQVLFPGDENDVTELKCLKCRQEFCGLCGEATHFPAGCAEMKAWQRIVEEAEAGLTTLPQVGSSEWPPYESGGGAAAAELAQAQKGTANDLPTLGLSTQLGKQVCPRCSQQAVLASVQSNGHVRCSGTLCGKSRLQR